MPDPTPVAGFLNLAKPRGPTSHDVVARTRRLTGVRRVGHAGTLDPLATGVLVLALGPATRLLEYVASGEKVYRATIRLGSTTTTDDAEGTVTATRPLTVGPADIAAALPQFVGEIAQRPPAFSAVQVGGRRAYDLARRGAAVELPARQVRIARLTVLDWQAPDLTLEVIVWSGDVYPLARPRFGGGARLRRPPHRPRSHPVRRFLPRRGDHAGRLGAPCRPLHLALTPGGTDRRVGAPPGPDRHPARQHPAAAGPACLLGPSTVNRTRGNPHGRPYVCTRCRGPADCHCGLRSASTIAGARARLWGKVRTITSQRLCRCKSYISIPSRRRHRRRTRRR